MPGRRQVQLQPLELGASPLASSAQDIDCIGNDIVLDRKLKAKKESLTTPRPTLLEYYHGQQPAIFSHPLADGEPQGKAKEPRNHPDSIVDALDLSTILNTLDGTLESPGRMVIMTSNNPERLDRALIRKGRVDLTLKFKRASEGIVRSMFASFFDRPWPDRFPAPKGGAWTPAEVSAILFDNFDHPDAAVTELVQDPVRW